MAFELWLILTAIIFTAFGIWVGKRNTIETTIDSLIDTGYLRTRRKSVDGELEILKWNDLSE